ncbi:MAG: methionine--tRNA ligase [Candidatus Woesearchaeota archaeon]
MAEKFYITTAIDYPSGKPHLGHCYEKVCSDVIARWQRLLIGKENVFFMTGLDEHGLKIERKAKEAGMEPQKYVDMMSVSFLELCKKYNVSYNRFIRTTEEDHVKYCQNILSKVHENGDIYLGKYEGLYCVECETFYTETELEEGKCPVHKKDCEHMSEEAYFFKMGKYQKQVEEYIRQGYILPKERTQHILSRMQEGVRDLCVSRTTFDWGVPLPFAPGHYAYVWFDALLNYASGVDGKDFWPANLHVIGHDIAWHHSVIWLSMLMSAGMELPKNLFVHGFIKAEGGTKMSKSLGNVVDPMEICSRYPVDSIRYFLIREVPFGKDGSFSEKALIARHNNELANSLGNLLNRLVVMASKYQGGVILRRGEDDLCSRLDFTWINELMKKYEIHTALAAIFDFIGDANGYINEKKPWELAKLGKKEELESTLYNLAEALRHIAILVYPFMPSTAEKIAGQLGINDFHEQDFSSLVFGLMENNRVKGGEILFEKIEEEKPEEGKEENKPAAKEEQPEKEEKMDENKDLGQNIGFFINKIFMLLENKFMLQVPKPLLLGKDTDFINAAGRRIERIVGLLNEKKDEEAKASIIELIEEADKYSESCHPWKDTERAKAVAFIGINLSRILALLVRPYSPELSMRIHSLLEVREEKDFSNIGNFIIKVGHKVKSIKSIDAPPVEFPEPAKPVESPRESPKREEPAEAPKTEESQKKEEPVEGLVAFNDWKKMKLKVGRVTKVEPHANADKLYVLQVDLGGEQRQLVAGLKNFYSAEELMGKKIIVVTNLQPANIRGVESRGMLLAAEDSEGNVKLLTTDGDMREGARVE